jgi:hypothetical protein
MSNNHDLNGICERKFTDAPKTPVRKKMKKLLNSFLLTNLFIPISL